MSDYLDHMKKLAKTVVSLATFKLLSQDEGRYLSFECSQWFHSLGCLRAFDEDSGQNTKHTSFHTMFQERPIPMHLTLPPGCLLLAWQSGYCWWVAHCENETGATAQDGCRGSTAGTALRSQRACCSGVPRQALNRQSPGPSLLDSASSAFSSSSQQSESPAKAFSILLFVSLDTKFFMFLNVNFNVNLTF